MVQIIGKRCNCPVNEKSTHCRTTTEQHTLVDATVLRRTLKRPPVGAGARLIRIGPVTDT